MDEFKDNKYKINIRDIKSTFIIKIIFSFLYRKPALNMIKYNKEIQKMFLIDIINYKKASGKYKIGEKNGKGKEYIINTNILIFEGEYINGKRNGKGKDYYNNDQLEFEGKYLKGKRNGEGKEYYNDDKLKFEGEYLNGKKWNGKGYNNNGVIDFEIRNGNGIGKEYYNNDKLKFEGEYLNGEIKGKEYYWNGKLEFEGEYLNGKRWNGKGFNIKNEKGKEYYSNDKLKFEGEYINGKRKGKAKEYD